MKKVPYCPHCKKIINRVDIELITSYTGYDYRMDDVTIDEDGETEYYEGDWEMGKGENGDSEPVVFHCPECYRDITDEVKKFGDGSVIFFDDEARECAEKFLKKGNRTLDEIMVDQL